MRAAIGVLAYGATLGVIAGQSDGAIAYSNYEIDEPRFGGGLSGYRVQRAMVDRAFGFGFTSRASGSVSEIGMLAVEFGRRADFSGAFRLYRDDGNGLPGALLGRWDINPGDLVQNGFSPVSTKRFAIDDGPVLEEGATYYFAVERTIQGTYYWNIGQPGSSARQVAQDNFGNWYDFGPSDITPEGAFFVRVVPGPGGAVAFAAFGASLVARRRR